MHTANEPALIAGVGTYALEFFDELPDVDYVLVPMAAAVERAGWRSYETGGEHRRRSLASRLPGRRVYAVVARQRASNSRQGGYAGRRNATRTTYDLTFGMLNCSSTTCDARGAGAEGGNGGGTQPDPQPCRGAGPPHWLPPVSFSSARARKWRAS